MSSSISHLPPVCNNELFRCDLRTIVTKFRQHNHSHLALVQLFSDKSAMLICYNIGRKKGPSSHFYMCWTEYDGNYSISLMHTLERPSYISLELLFLIIALLSKALVIKAVLILFIIPLLSKKLSIVFEGSILFSPFVVERSVATKQSREDKEIATPRLIGARNDKKGRWLATTI